MASVPKYSSLKPSTQVNIILKADQPTGRLTTGIIADILTRGDHPRGVKVRLQSGAIGRVQSLATSQSAAARSGDQQNSNEDAKNPAAESAVRQPTSLPARNFRFQDDFRKTEPPPNPEASLTDFIKAPSRNKNKKKKTPTSSSS